MGSCIDIELDAAEMILPNTRLSAVLFVADTSCGCRKMLVHLKQAGCRRPRGWVD